MPDNQANNQTKIQEPTCTKPSQELIDSAMRSVRGFDWQNPSQANLVLINALEWERYEHQLLRDGGRVVDADWKKSLEECLRDNQRLEDERDTAQKDHDRLQGDFNQVYVERDRATLDLHIARQELTDTQADRNNLIEQRNVVMLERDHAIRAHDAMAELLKREQLTSQLLRMSSEAESRQCFRLREELKKHQDSADLQNQQHQPREWNPADQVLFSRGQSLQREIDRLKSAFEVLITQMNSTSGFDPAVLRARLAGEK